MQKLLIADSVEDFRFELEEALSDSYQVLTCANGKEAKRLLSSFRPDILILDILIPELDGISVLHSALRANIQPMVLVITRYYNDFILESMANLNVGYVMRKPCDLHAVICRVKELSKRLTPPVSTAELQFFASKHLKKLGVSSHLDGYLFLKTGLPLYVRDTKQRLSKELYVAIAAATGFDNVQQIEHSIRTAIEAAWRNHDAKIWLQYFSASSDGKIAKPSNRIFLSSLADKLLEDLLTNL